MPDNSNKLSQFWQELKRQKVIKLIALVVAGLWLLSPEMYLLGSNFIY